MSFRFSWVLIFLIIQVALWLYWYFNQKDKDFIYSALGTGVLEKLIEQNKNFITSSRESRLLLINGLFKVLLK